MVDRQPNAQKKGSTGDAKLISSTSLGIIACITFFVLLYVSHLTTSPSPVQGSLTSPSSVINTTANPAAPSSTSPNPVNQSVITKQNTPVNITLAAENPNPRARLTAHMTSNPIEGTLSSINQNTGIVTYTPKQGFTGIDSFTFKVNDGKVESRNVGIVNIRVSGTEPPPPSYSIYVLNQASNTVSVINSTTNKVVATIPVGVHPVAIKAAYNIYVANQASNTVSVINSTTNKVVATIPVGVHPTQMDGYTPQLSGQ